MSLAAPPGVLSANLLTDGKVVEAGCYWNSYGALSANKTLGAR